MLDAQGLVFVTNDGSRKAGDLRANPRGVLCFHWPLSQAQVRAERIVLQVLATESDAYFASRPRESQLAAWASRQSETLASREDLMAAYFEASARFEGRQVDRPPFWAGFRLVPHRREYSLGPSGESRLLFP